MGKLRQGALLWEPHPRGCLIAHVSESCVVEGWGLAAERGVGREERRESHIPYTSSP